LVRQGAQQMGQLIDDLLKFSRMGRQPLQRQRVVTPQIVRQCLEELQPEQQGRHVRVAFGELPDCWADPALLKQVFLNLVSNALKYTRQKPEAVIEVNSRADSQAAGGRVYYVRDNGAGFDMRYADKLFGVFQRLHRSEDYAGTGVGLALAQRIVHRHGGRIWAEAEVEKGATFYFTLEGGPL
jgi:light-regulated signal transduction histidine kinase (bacteriophytochrome)